MTLFPYVWVVLAIVLGFAATLFWVRATNKRSHGPTRGVHSRIGYTHTDGMASIALLLSNEDGQPAWVEELDVTLTELEAEDQVSPPSLRVTQKIRQLIRPGEMIPISLAGTIYKAAGEPQKWHSCVLSPSVRYRIGNEAFESVMDNYRIEMQGLIASSIRRERMKSSPLAVPKGSSDIQVAEMKSK